MFLPYTLSSPNLRWPYQTGQTVAKYGRGRQQLFIGAILPGGAARWYFATGVPFVYSTSPQVGDPLPNQSLGTKQEREFQYQNRSPPSQQTAQLKPGRSRRLSASLARSYSTELITAVPNLEPKGPAAAKWTVKIPHTRPMTLERSRSVMINRRLLGRRRPPAAAGGANQRLGRHGRSRGTGPDRTAPQSAIYYSTPARL